ncbi:MAG: hypothetical protein JWN48_561 [Myxococcaceae bacterium]|nr:hypothetical protein [Myxococcaceae bacterium]
MIASGLRVRPWLVLTGLAVSGWNSDFNTDDAQLAGRLEAARRPAIGRNPQCC